MWNKKTQIIRFPVHFLIIDEWMSDLDHAAALILKEGNIISVFSLQDHVYNPLFLWLKFELNIKNIFCLLWMQEILCQHLPVFDFLFCCY